MRASVVKTWRVLADLTFFVAVVVLSFVVLVATLLVRIVGWLVAVAGSLMVLGCIVVTVAVLCGLMKPFELLAWFYAAGLFVAYCLLLALREKLAAIPVWIVDWRDYRRRAASVERISRLRLAAPTRDA
jgi:hypothetical protein